MNKALHTKADVICIAVISNDLDETIHKLVSETIFIYKSKNTVALIKDMRKSESALTQKTIKYETEPRAYTSKMSIKDFVNAPWSLSAVVIWPSNSKCVGNEKVELMLKIIFLIRSIVLSHTKSSLQEFTSHGQFLHLLTQGSRI